MDEIPKTIKILAWDCSGSTSECENYFTIGRKHLEQFSSESSGFESVYLLWDSACQLSSFEEIMTICNKKEGRGSTYPSNMIQWISKTYPAKPAIELWLITDGQIWGSELKDCCRLNKDVNYSKIKFFVIDTRYSPTDELGLSVGASFFNGSEIEIFSNDQLLKKVNTSKPFDYESINISNLEEKWAELSVYIKFKFMGSDLESLKEVEKLNRLRSRLLISIQNQPSDSDLRLIFESCKDKQDVLNAIKELSFYKTITGANANDQRSLIDGSVSTLVNYIHNEHKSFGFDGLKMAYKQEKLSEVKEEDEPGFESLDDVQECNFYDAVTLENEVGTPVLLLTKTDLIHKYWEGKNYGTFRTIMDCPFFAQIEECVGHVYLMETFQSLCSSGPDFEGRLDYNISNPMTNEPVFGGLIFSPKADAWNDFVLANTFFRGKKVKTCLDLWYYVIWKHVEDKKWIEPGIKSQLEAYAFRRLSFAKVPLAFSTLPLDPKDIVPLYVACFYSTEGSSLLFAEHPTLFLQERLRMFHSVAEDMIKILERLQKIQGFNKFFVERRATVFYLVKKLKQIPQIGKKRKFLFDKIFESTPEGFLTYKIKDKDYLSYLSLLNYEHKSMIPLDFANKSPLDVRSIVQTVYETAGSPDVQICMETCRPFFIVNDPNLNDPTPYYSELKKHCKEISLNSSGDTVMGSITNIDQSRLVSHCKFYIDLTNKLKRFPSWDEYISYTVDKRGLIKENGIVYLVSPEIIKRAKYYFDLYSNLGVVDVKEFIDKSQKSTNIKSRILMEGSFKGSDKDLDEFILSAKLIVGN